MTSFVAVVDWDGDADPTSPYKITMAYLKRETKVAFDQEAFGMLISDPAAGSPKATVRSKVLTKQQWKERVKYVSSWNTGDGTLDVAGFRKSAPCPAYAWAKQSKCLPMTLESTLSPNGRMVVQQGMIFDIIKENHTSASSHLKVARITSLIKEKYHNIPKQLVQLCPICTCQQPKVKPMKGAKKPIAESLGFRDSFQVDLVDYHEDPQQWDPNDPNAPTYRWMLVVEDHFTRRCDLR